MLKKEKDRLNNVFSTGRESGFTLLELLVAAALSLVVMAGIYSVYKSQQRSYVVREQVTLMQQNLRAGMVVMTDDIRMAGYVHPNITGVTAGITAANQTSLKFTLLKNKDDDPEDNAANQVLEAIQYSINGTELKRDIDEDNDGTFDKNQTVAENIDALDFVYLDANDNEVINPNSNLANIRSIQVTMVARSGRSDPNYQDAEINPTYENQLGETIYTPGADDNFRRRILSREIRCRNL